MTDRPEWEKINAFVDGELSASEKAAMADAVARDSELARKVATVARMKAELFECFEAEPARKIDLPTRRIRDDQAGKRARWAAAAALLLVALLGAFGIYATSTEAQSAWLTAAVKRHHALSAAPTGNLGNLSTFVELRGQQALVPNLASGKLTLTSLADFDLGKGNVGLAAHYRGTRGCRVTLFLIPEPARDLSSELTLRQGTGFIGYEWRHGSVGYLLLAEGMADTRLKLIADKVHEASGKLKPLDDIARQQLADSRRRSSPCQA